MSSKICVLARAVILEDDHLLLAYPTENCSRTPQGASRFYFLPGGHIERHESAVHALVREIREELGLPCDVERFLGVIEHAWARNPAINDCHTHELNLIFKARIAGLSPQDPVPQREPQVAFCWQPLVHLAHLDFRPAPLKTVLPQWIASPESKFLSTLWASAPPFSAPHAL
ncbi:MAG: NUDIX domain-containing protein [Holosporales bacterium]